MELHQRIAWLNACTKRERDEYYGRVIKFGCVACSKPFTPEGLHRTTLHHCSGHSFPAKRENRPVIPLCRQCHQDGKVSIHRAKTTFQLKYGSQEELAEKVEGMIDGR